jgi:hypothetical protein
MTSFRTVILAAILPTVALIEIPVAGGGRVGGATVQPVTSQPSTPVMAVTLGVPAASQPLTPILRQGTEVRFKTLQPLASGTSHEGDRFELLSVEDVKVGSLLVIPAGSRAVGEVTRVVKKGAFGKSGKLDARILFVVVGENHIPMDGKANEAGEAGTAGVVAAGLFLWPVMPFITGTSATLPIGTPMAGFVENDIPLVAAVTPPAPPMSVPMVVPVVAAAAPAPAAAPVAATAPATVTAAPVLNTVVAPRPGPRVVPNVATNVPVAVAAKQ